MHPAEDELIEMVGYLSYVEGGLIVRSSHSCMGKDGGVGDLTLEDVG